MANNKFTYIIIGGGLAGMSAAEGIRDVDKSKPVLLIGQEKQLPYDRPPLTKGLWLGKKKFEDIFVHDSEFYEKNHINLQLASKVVALNPTDKEITDDKGNSYKYEKLLLATGAHPRRLNLPGGDTAGLCYYRYADDYLQIKEQAAAGKSALIVGGGFIGSELAASLNTNQVDVTMLFPNDYICENIFPPYLGHSIMEHYRQRGVKVMTGDRPASFGKDGQQFITRTAAGQTIYSDMVIIGIGVVPELELAEKARLNTGNGILVDAYLQTSHPDIYAAGDNAYFPMEELGLVTRVEHWDNALSQGKFAGRNMAGAYDEYTHIPYFFSDLFEFGYEAAGMVSSKLDTYADWQKENDTGVIYYLDNNRLRGMMMCNVWEKVGRARELLKKNITIKRHEELKGMIR